MSDENAFAFLKPIQRASTVVELPSRGVLYTGELAKGRVELSPMTMSEETLLSSGAGSNNILPLIDDVLRRCIVFPKHIDMRELISADKYFLLIMLRAVTFGSEYSFTWTCMNTVIENGRRTLCGRVNTRSVFIPDEFNIKKLDPEDKEPYIVTLPESGKEIGLRLLRGGDEAQIDEYEKTLAKNERHRTSVYSLAKHIVMVDGNKITPETPVAQLLTFVSSLPAKDVGALRDTVEYYTPGIDTSLSVKCTECRYEEEMDLPLSAEFFRAKPTKPGRPNAAPLRSDVLPPDEPDGDIDDTDQRAGVVPQKASRGRKRKTGSESS